MKRRGFSRRWPRTRAALKVLTLSTSFPHPSYNASPRAVGCLLAVQARSAVVTADRPRRAGAVRWAGLSCCSRRPARVAAGVARRTSHVSGRGSRRWRRRRECVGLRSGLHGGRGRGGAEPVLSQELLRDCEGRCAVPSPRRPPPARPRRPEKNTPMPCRRQRRPAPGRTSTLAETQLYSCAPVGGAPAQPATRSQTAHPAAAHSTLHIAQVSGRSDGPRPPPHGD